MAKAKELIQAATIARISDKAGNLICWSVKSNHSDSAYMVRCKKIGSRCFWFCDCEAKKYGYNGLHSTKQCAHVKAVIAVGIARRESRKHEQAQTIMANFFAALSQYAEQQTGWVLKIIQHNHNGSGVFSVERIADLSGMTYRQVVNMIDALNAQGQHITAKGWSGYYYISMATSAEREAVAEAERIVRQREVMPLNGNQGFSLLKH